MNQTLLNFDRPHNSTPTSIAAADSQAPSKCDKDRQAILEHVRSAGGATRDEIEAATGIQGNTVRPRVWELVRAGKLVESGEKRKTRGGCWAVVLMAGA